MRREKSWPGNDADFIALGLKFRTHGADKIKVGFELNKY
ncbi:uncharacterized protein METZ01_LOCUS338650 [marine metagenome]|uniref:Uncharacterized protein n=1 Tax=marine metagenome TaxID=408172 RepID=A0A382QK17_9ZZZZ